MIINLTWPWFILWSLLFFGMIKDILMFGHKKEGKYDYMDIIAWTILALLYYAAMVM